MKMINVSLLLVLTILLPRLGTGQEVPWSPLKRGSDNMDVLGHLPLGPRLSVADMDIEQELMQQCVIMLSML